MIRILLVEDSQVFRKSFKQSLHDLFPTVVIEEEASGEDAWRKVNGHPPHLIFMDLRLPGINGLQATRKIKSAFPDIHIAILTGNDVPEYREAALKSGAERFFVKESLEWEEGETFVKSIEQILYHSNFMLLTISPPP